MPRPSIVLVLTLMSACGSRSAPPVVDSAAVAKRADDSLITLRTQQASALEDTARRTLAVLLKHPETATFDSLMVVQPPKEGTDWPLPVVCGRINGKPGIGGRSTPTPFIYQSRVNVFVLDRSNATAFEALRGRGCGNPAGRVVLK